MRPWREPALECARASPAWIGGGSRLPRSRNQRKAVNIRRLHHASRHDGAGTDARRSPNARAGEHDRGRADGGAFIDDDRQRRRLFAMLAFRAMKVVVEDLHECSDSRVRSDPYGLHRLDRRPTLDHHAVLDAKLRARPGVELDGRLDRLQADAVANDYASLSAHGHPAEQDGPLSYLGQHAQPQFPQGPQQEGFHFSVTARALVLHTFSRRQNVVATAPDAHCWRMLSRDVLAIDPASEIARIEAALREQVHGHLRR